MELVSNSHQLTLYIDQYVTVEHNRSLAKYLDSSASKLPQKA